MPGIDHSSRRVNAPRRSPRVGELVVLEQFPAGYPRWRVTKVPAAAGPSDVVDLEPDDPGCPVTRTRRYISTVRIVEGR